MQATQPLTRKKAYKGQFYDRIDSSSCFEYTHQFPKLPKYWSKLLSSIFKLDGITPGQL